MFVPFFSLFVDCHFFPLPWFHRFPLFCVRSVCLFVCLGCKIGDDGAKMLSECLKVNSSVSVMRLSGESHKQFEHDCVFLCLNWRLFGGCFQQNWLLWLLRTLVEKMKGNVVC